MSGLSWAVHATVSLAASVSYLVVAASVVHLLAVSPPASPPGPDLLGKLAQHIATGISRSYLLTFTLKGTVARELFLN